MIVFPDYGDPCPLSGCYSVHPIISAPILSGFGCSSFPHSFGPIKNAIGTTHGSRTDGVVAIRMPIGAGYQPGIGALGLRHPKFHISLGIATTLWVETGQKTGRIETNGRATSAETRPHPAISAIQR
jgi:hypothetical protein